MSSGPSREVTVRFHADFSEYRKEMAAAAKDTKKFNDDSWKAEKARADESERAVAKRSKIEQTAAKETAKSLKEMERLEKQRYAEQDRMDRRQFNARMKIIGDRQKAEEKAARDIERVEAKKAQEIARMDQRRLNAQLKAIKDRERAETDAAKRAERAQKTYEGRERRAFGQELKVDRFAEGAIRQFAGAGKSALMLSGLSEQDTEKMLRNLLKIQLVYETILGAKEGVEMLQRAWRAYSYSVKLAAEAHAALAIAQAAGVGGAAAGGVRGAAGGMAGGVAGGVAGGAGFKAAAAGAGVMPWAGAIAGGGLGLLSAGLTGREAWKHGIGGGATPGSYVESVGASDWNPFSWAFGGFAKAGRNRSEKRMTEMEKRRAAEQERVGRYQEGIQRDYGLNSMARDEMHNSRVGGWGSRLSSINIDETTGGNRNARSAEAGRIVNEEGVWQRAQTREREALQSKKANQETINAAIDRERQAVERVTQARIMEVETLKQGLEIQKQQAETAKQQANSEFDKAKGEFDQFKAQGFAGAEAWNSAGAGKQRRFQAIRNKLKKGGELTRSEETLYRESGLDQQEDLQHFHQQQAMAKANRSGFGAFAGDANQHQMDVRMNRMQGADQQIAQQHNLNVKIEGELRSKDRDVDIILKQRGNELQKLIKITVEEAMKNWKSEFDNKEPTTPKGKDQAFQMNGRMAAVAGQV